MLKKTITYKDYNGVERTEDFWFNLNETEITEMELGVHGGYTAMVNKIIATKDFPTLIKIFKDLVLAAYGEKSADGRMFTKRIETVIVCLTISNRQKHTTSCIWNWLQMTRLRQNSLIASFLLTFLSRLQKNCPKLSISNYENNGG